MLYAVNKMNRQFRFAKFVVDFEDNTISIEIDFPISCSEVGGIAVEMLFRVMNMADEAYAEFMKAAWSN